MQQDSSIFDIIEAKIPTSLRCIHFYIFEAQRYLWLDNVHGSIDTRNSRKRIAIEYINKSLEVLSILPLRDDIDLNGINFLQSLILLRNYISNELNINTPPEINYLNSSRISLRLEYVLSEEANAILSIADFQLEEGNLDRDIDRSQFRNSAAENFHTACLFYRILESIYSINAFRDRLLYCITRSRQLSSLFSNVIGEHLNGCLFKHSYHISENSKLGDGSYGTVYRTNHRIINDLRAVKVIYLIDKLTPYYIRKIHNEISILKKVDHPNIIKIYDIYFGKTSVYIVTNLCLGGELCQLVDSGRNQGYVFREDSAAKIMLDAMKAIKYLHSKNIIHRDIKLENFLFETSSLTSPLVLIDFGLSIQSLPGEKLSQRVGSVYYAAPEVLLGSYDHKYDIWALGVVCFMILSGSTPFFCNVPRDQRESAYNEGILHRELVFPNRPFHNISDCCKDFISKLMTKDPNLRITASEALKHPFLTGVSRQEYNNMSRKLISKESADHIIRNMSIYLSANPLMKLALVLISNSLSIEQITEFRNEFEIMDYNSNGVLSLEDLQVNLSSSDYYLQFDISKAYDDIAIELSHKRSNGLNYHEFIAGTLCKRIVIEESRLELVFNILDPRGYGYVTANSLAEILGSDLSPEIIKQMIATNNNGNSYVTIEEFKYQFRLMLIA